MRENCRWPMTGLCLCLFLLCQLKASKSHAAVPPPESLSARGSQALDTILDFLETGESDGNSWLTAQPYDDEPTVGEQATVLLAFCFDSLRHMHSASVEALQEASRRSVEQKRQLAERYQQVCPMDTHYPMESTDHVCDVALLME